MSRNESGIVKLEVGSYVYLVAEMLMSNLHKLRPYFGGRRRKVKADGHELPARFTAIQNRVGGCLFTQLDIELVSKQRHAPCERHCRER